MIHVGFGNVCHALNVITVVDSVQRGKSDKTYYLNSQIGRDRITKRGGGGGRLIVLFVRLQMSKKKSKIYSTRSVACVLQVAYN